MLPVVFREEAKRSTERGDARRRVYLKIIRLACDDNYNINHDQLARNVFITMDGLTVARHLYDEKAT